MRKHERWLLFSVATVTAVVAFTDWPLELTSGFWTDHPMLGAIVSGLVLFAVAAFVVEAWIERREAAQSRRVAGLAYWGLGQALLAYANGLEELADVGRVEGRAVVVFEGEQGRAIAEYFDGRSDPLPANLAERVASLAADHRWLRLANPAVRYLKIGLSDAISQWAPVMLASESLATALNRAAAVGYDAGRIHRPIWQELGDKRDSGNESDWKANLGLAWVECRDQLLEERERLIENLPANTGPDSPR